MKQKLVPSGWLEREGRRLDCGPYLSGAMEAKVLLERLPVPRADLCSLTHGHEGGVFIGQQFARNYVSDPAHGVPFLRGSTMLHADFTHADLLKKSDATSPRLAHLRIEEGMTLVSRSGTIGRMVYARPEMSGLWATEDAIKIVPDPARVRPGYLYAFLSGRFGLPLVTGGTYGAVVQHIEPQHVARVPVPLAPDDVQEEAHRLVTEAAAMRTTASAKLRAVIREIEEAAGLPPIPRRSGEASPDTSLVKVSALAGRLDGLFHSSYHRSAREPLLALPAARRTTVGELAERVFRPPMFKKIIVKERHFGLPFFSTASILRSDPDTDAILSKRVKGIEDLIVNELTVLVPADGQLNGIIGHPVLPIGDVVGGDCEQSRHQVVLFERSERRISVRLSLVRVFPASTQGARVRFFGPGHQRSRLCGNQRRRAAEARRPADAAARPAGVRGPHSPARRDRPGTRGARPRGALDRSPRDGLMAKVIAIGQPVNDSEREAIASLRDHLPDTFTVIHNFELRQGHEIYEIDVALLGPHCVHVIDVKGTRGLIDVHGGKWYPEGRAPYHSPLALLRKHAKALKSLICDRYPTNRALRGLYVDAAVLMTAPDALVQDPGGQDGPAVAYLGKCAAFFQARARIPDGRSTDVRAHLGQVRKAIVGQARPRNAPPCYGHWQVEEKLGGTDRYTEYRARHTLLGAKRGGTARLRIYPVDPYRPEAERQRERRRIENAFRAVAALPGHPNVLTVREFFPTESEDRFVLVSGDVAGHALRQHVRKSALALTFDQKIAVARDVLAALDHAHRSEPQVVHRNLTPDAVIVGAAGRALLCGFDYARAGGERASTIAEDVVDELDPVYQAPECYRDPSRASVASDLYAAGLVFYELLVGEPAWTSIDDMMDKDGVFPVKPSEQKPELPAGFDEWLQALCAFDVEERPSTAAVALARFNDVVGPDPREGGRAGGRERVAPVAARPEVDYAALQRGDDLAGRFRIEEKLGQGGFAVAYRVFDSFSDTSRVLKLIVRDRRSTFERLKQEYGVLERLPPHPNVVRAVWADRLADDTPYMVFEYVPGTGVDKLLDDGSLSPEDVKRIGVETLTGLAHLHGHGVFHRDVKPSNLLWTDRGVRIIDFNVAVRHDDEDARPGGTRRYVPPDLAPADDVTAAEQADRDLFALGVTLYECVSGKYPWDGPTPVPGAAPRDPREFTFRSDLAAGFVQALLRAIAPYRADRFASAAEFREALAAADVRAVPPAPPVGAPTAAGAGAPPWLRPAKPNFNPFVSHLQAMYSQSPRSNAGTRGLDEIGRETYVRTLLDERLREALLAGAFRLVVVTGNAGDGKTAYIQQIERATELAPTLVQRPNGSEFHWSGRRFVTNHDGSQDEDDKANDDVLREFFQPFEGGDGKGWPDDETRIIAVNEGRLVDFLTEHESRFRRLRAIVQAGLAGAAPEEGVATVNLNLRSVVADPPGAGPGQPDAIFDRLVRRLTAEKFWAPCAGCDLRERCYVHHNARTLMDPVAGPKVAERLRAVYAITHLRGRLHITMRDLRSALAFTLAGARDCDEVHALYAGSGAEARRRILHGFYFNAWQGGDGSGDRLLALLRQIDVGEATNPDLDRALDYLPPDAGEMARFAFDRPGDYDTRLLERLYRELPRDASAPAPRRMAEHRGYVAMLRRRQFFERRDEHWKEMLPYRTYGEFWKLVAGEIQPGTRCPKLLMAINRGEGLGDPGRLGDALALRVRFVEHGTVRSYRLFPGEHFRLAPPAQSDHPFVEHMPQALRLVHAPPGGQPVELLVDLDVYEMLSRLHDGYRPSLEELQGHYLTLTVFKNVLSSAPYQEVLLTRTGHDYFRIRREDEGVLALEALTGEAG